jgi:salicylate hydroxylase
MITQFNKWKLHDLLPLPSWVHQSGKVTLLGDSCHAALPYLGQGAAGAFEDAACLGRMLRTSPSILTALYSFQQIRKPRSTVIQVKSRMHQEILHVEDGAFQVERDQKMAKDGEENPLFWGSLERRKWLFDYDAEVASNIENLSFIV